MSHRVTQGESAAAASGALNRAEGLIVVFQTLKILFSITKRGMLDIPPYTAGD